MAGARMQKENRKLSAVMSGWGKTNAVSTVGPSIYPPEAEYVNAGGLPAARWIGILSSRNPAC